MKPLIRILPIKEKKRELLTIGDITALESLLGSMSVELTKLYPVFLNDVMLEVSLKQHGLQVLIEQASQIPDRQLASYTRGALYTLAGSPTDALHALASSLESKEGDPLSCIYAARSCVQKGLLKEAAQLYEAAGDYRLPESWLELAKVYNSLGYYPRAHECFEKAFEVFNDDETLLSLIVFLRDRLRMEEQFRSSYQQRLLILLDVSMSELQDREAELLGMKADVAYIRGDDQEAESLYREALNLDPNNLSAEVNLSYCLLRQSKFEEGWALNSNRTAVASNAVLQYEGLSLLPKWEGQCLKNKTMLVLSEQGVGDQILFVRYLLLLQSRFVLKDIVCIVEPRIASLFEFSDFGKVRFVSVDSTKLNAQGFDYYSYLGDLPRNLGAGTDATLFKSEQYIYAHRTRVHEYRDKYFKLFGNKKKIGITWKSSSRLSGDRKNLELASMAPLFELENVQWICLQYGDVSEDLYKLNTAFETNIYVDETVDLTNNLALSAVQIMALDLVVTVSNATAHLCGALGVDCLLLTSKSPMWYWGGDGEKSVFYPSISIYRQKEHNQWLEVVERVKKTISENYTSVTSKNTISDVELHKAFTAGKYQQIIERLSGEPVASLTFAQKLLLANSFLKEGFPTEVTRVLDYCSIEEKHSEETLLLYAKVGIYKKQFAQAETILNSIVQNERTVNWYLVYIDLFLSQEIHNPSVEHAWKTLLKISSSDQDLDALVVYFSEVVKKIGQEQYFNVVKFNMLKQMLEDFDRSFGKRNPVVNCFLKAEMYNLEGQPEKAIAYYEKAIKIKPELKQRFTNTLGYCFLRVGEFKKGFQLVEERLMLDKRLTRSDSLTYEYEKLKHKHLNKSKGKVLLITSEQGLGDQLLGLQFVRKLQTYFKGKVVLKVDSKLLPVVKETFSDLLYVGSDLDQLPENILSQIDYQLPIASISALIPEIFENYTPVDQIIKANPERVQFYRNKYKERFGDKKLIGVSWRSASPTWKGRKDMNLDDFKPLLSAEDIQCISIQYSDVKSEIDDFNAANGVSLFLDESFDATNDLKELFCQIAALDAVVTISNVNAHFAGGLNIPVHLLVKKMCLWHWHANTSQSMWYPSMTIHREREFNEWGQVMAELVNEL
ncbi:tetratricopeptide repeat protein [Litoribrevibacter albus]|uniref:Tetratricopeptide repeat protein n=1 Tax=Litoribrevibacter albus TaxID=1473156 RepID=A0AA37W931_9GAMM|nr:hypothetical protein [Litoribrevibacter albus]GLQ32231.1 hypothetical protein GCM10007876_27100 [Litoribrevibacter albus]